ISGVVKNALDPVGRGRGGQARPYFEGRPVGCVVTTQGGQAAGAALAALRSIIHALRGWPTPYGAALNGAVPLFDDQGACREARDAWQLTTVAEQVMEFARMKADQT
ncbi:MAG TPA: FMN reductase, partial [Phenylobacterium sp.]|nr:FMN reductase [Phenylobacterium sp.]